MYYYRIYGLIARSELRLNLVPEVKETDTDVSISLGELQHIDSIPGETAAYLNSSGLDAIFSWPEVGNFLVRQGEEIIYDPIAGVDERIIPFPLLGMVFSAILLQRKTLVLHASAVSMDGMAVVFMGTRGMGKSTLAASLYARGYTLLTDDLVALKQSGDCQSMLLPGYPQLKLMPDMAQRFFRNEDVDLQLNGHGKLVCNALRDFSSEPFPVRCIYCLSIDPVIAISPMRSEEAMLELIRQSYVARVFGDFPSKTEAAAHFRHCAEVARSVPVFRLRRPDSPGLLDALTKTIEAHFLDIQEAPILENK